MNRPDVDAISNELRGKRSSAGVSAWGVIEATDHFGVFQPVGAARDEAHARKAAKMLNGATPDAFVERYGAVCVESTAGWPQIDAVLDARVGVGAIIARYAADWGRMRRTGLSRADLLRRFLLEVETVRKVQSR